MSRYLVRLMIIYSLFQGKKIEAPIRNVVNFPLVIAVHMEVDSLAHILLIDSIDSPLPNPKYFASYARANLLYRPGKERDTSRDFWGTPYRLVSSRFRFMVISAGPDRVFRTTDDISSGGRILCACN